MYETSFVTEYFIKVEAGMEKIDVIGGPVYASNTVEEIVGRITDYYKKTGFMKIELIKAVHYNSLIKFGVLMEHIVFKNIA